MHSETSRTAIVLGGGGARGAYEIGVLAYIFEDLARDVGPVPVEIVCGTSAGAINALSLAAFADEPLLGVSMMARRWTDLRFGRVVRPDLRQLAEVVRALLGSPPRKNPLDRPWGGVLDLLPLRRLLSSAIPFDRIAEHVRSGRLVGASVSATEIATGRTAVFVQNRGPGSLTWSRRSAVIVRPARLGIEHALASAAIPFLFPPVRIDGRLYCDGSLRQNVPLSPARRLGADRLLVVSPRHAPADEPPPPTAEERERSFPGPIFLAGKTLGALIADRLDNDVDRQDRINGILAAGTRAFGDGFIASLNRELERVPGQAVRPVQTVLLRPSVSLGQLAASFIRSTPFRRSKEGAVGRLLLCLAENDAPHEADLVSYLLFDGRFAHELMELGRQDARREHDRLAQLLASRHEEPRTAVGGGL